MPDGLLVAVPVPVPVRLTVSMKLGIGVKVAVTFCAEFVVTIQVEVPVQAPLKPAKNDPAAGAAVSVTMVPPA